MNKPATYYTRTRPEMCIYIPETHVRVLEVGCSNGGFRANLAKAAEVWGIEPVADAAQHAAEKLHRVLHGVYQEVCEQLPDNYFDLVICNDVMEHMADDEYFLRDIQRKMTKGGRLMGSVPNMRLWPVLKGLLFSKEWEYQDEGVLDRTHLRFYTVKTLPRLLKRCGYKVEKFSPVNRHVHKSTKFWINFFSLGMASDMVYMQLAFVARKD